MAVSEAIYGTTISYVSSSAYYGFVPQNNHHDHNKHRQPGSNWDVNVNVNVNMKESSNGNDQPQYNAGAMETDDDSHDVDLVNNYCVIPEALRGINPALYHSNYSDGHLHPVPVFAGAIIDDRQSRHDAFIPAGSRIRRNRKRNNDGELMPVEPDQLKRLREGSGNCGTYHGRGFSKDGGLAKVYYKSPRLCINRGNYRFEKEGKREGEDEEVKRKEKISTIATSCCWAAGNHSISLVNHDDDKNEDLLLNGNFKLRGDVGDLEYEKMLLETHGCSAYHHHRFESEF